jgi:hypothetical protein
VTPILRELRARSLSAAEGKFRPVSPLSDGWTTEKSHAESHAAIQEVLATVADYNEFRLALLFCTPWAQEVLREAVAQLPEAKSAEEIESARVATIDEGVAFTRRELEAAAAYLHSL